MSLDKNNLEEKVTFTAGCFSTNYENLSPISIMKQYFLSSECQDIFYKDSQVDFTHKILEENGTTMVCTNSFFEFNLLQKKKKITVEIDCFIIFLDLENNNSLVELNKILEFISKYCNKNLKIYVLNIFTVEKNIKSNLTDDNINVYFGNYYLTNYDISSVNLGSSDELVKVIDSLTKETLSDKSLLNTIKNDADNSKSYCLFL